MARTIKQPDRATVTALLKATLVQDMKSATKALKDFERTYDMYPQCTVEDAERIYRECAHIARTSDHSILRYNALRLLKYIVTTEDFLRAHAADIWTLYKETIFDQDGTIRNAGHQLMSRYRFGMFFIADPYPFKKRRWGKKRTEEINHFQKMLVEQCLEMFEIEKQYRETHPDIEDIEEERLCGIICGSWETKNKYLKTIRRGMEEVTRGTSIEKLAEKHGYALPRHWLFEGQAEEQENEWPPGTEGDIAGMLIDPTENTPIMISDPPDPQSFSTFEAYQESLSLRDDFLEKAQAVSAVLSSDQSEEEIDRAMKDLGFQKHDDAPCNRTWCIERYGCIAMTLIGLLQEIEDGFFGGVLAPKQPLLSHEERERCERIGCHALPQKWFAETTREHEVFRWFMSLMDALGWNERHVPFASLAKDPVESAFVREAYLFVLSELRKYPWKQEHEGKGLIAGFLRENDLLQSEESARLLKEFEGLL